MAVDRRRRAERRAAGVRQQAGEPAAAGVGQQRAGVVRLCVGGLAHERVAAGGQLDERLVQVPAARHHVGERRPARRSSRGSRRAAGPAARRCGTRSAPSGRRRRARRRRRRPPRDLARPELDLERAAAIARAPARCALDDRRAAHRRGRPTLRRAAASRGGRARPRAARRARRPAPGASGRRRCGRCGTRPRARSAGRSRPPRARPAPTAMRAGGRWAPASRRRTTAARAASRCLRSTAGGCSERGSGSSTRLLAAPKPGSAASAPGSNTFSAVRSEVSFSIRVLTMPTPSSARCAAPSGDHRLAAQQAVDVAPADAEALEAAVVDVAQQALDLPRRRSGAAALGETGHCGWAIAADNQAAPARLAAACSCTRTPASGRWARCSRSCRDRAAPPPRRCRRQRAAGGRRRAPSRWPSAAGAGSP